MSIIYEALKKAQQQLKIISINKEQEKHWLWFYLGFIFISSIGCIFALFLFFYAPKIKSINISKSSLEQKNIHKDEEKSKLPTQSSPEVKYESASQEFPKISLKLNGIIYMNGEYIALINDKILKKDDFIEGAQVVKISNKQVDLKFQDKSFNLKIK